MIIKLQKVASLVGCFVAAWILCEVVDGGMNWLKKEAKYNVKNNLVHVTR